MCEQNTIHISKRYNILPENTKQQYAAYVYLKSPEGNFYIETSNYYDTKEEAKKAIITLLDILELSYIIEEHEND